MRVEPERLGRANRLPARIDQRHRRNAARASGVGPDTGRRVPLSRIGEHQRPTRHASRVHRVRRATGVGDDRRGATHVDVDRLESRERASQPLTIRGAERLTVKPSRAERTQPGRCRRVQRMHARSDASGFDEPRQPVGPRIRRPAGIVDVDAPECREHRDKAVKPGRKHTRDGGHRRRVIRTSPRVTRTDADLPWRPLAQPAEACGVDLVEAATNSILSGDPPQLISRVPFCCHNPSRRSFGVLFA